MVERKFIAFIALLEICTSMDHLKKQLSSDDDNLIFCTIQNEVKTSQKSPDFLF
jgi:hypothetical protein